MKGLFRYFTMLGYAIDFISHVELNIITWYKQIKWIEKIAWFKLHFNKKKKKHSFMKHNVLDDKI